MTVSSNIYAEKIFAEHPIDLWVLNDPVDYVSLITEAQRAIPTASGWIIENGTANTNDLSISSPFNNSYTTKIVGDSLSDPTYTISVTSPNLVSMSTLNSDIATVSISAYIYSQILDAALESISMGIEYTLPGDTEPTVIEKTIEFINLPQWTLIGETFNIINQNIPFKVFIKANVNDNGGLENYNFYINGLAVGQLSSEFSATSLGVTPSAIPSNIALPSGITGVSAEAYGLSEDDGYYLVRNNILTAKNTSIPLVFGASNLTVISENKFSGNSVPSLIIPGKGFLNKKGQYSDYTIEFWLRINNDAIEPKRIFGPIASNDGLYVEDGFLTLSIGGITQSYFVNEWYRPMLVNIRLIRNSVSMLINGEEVINFALNTAELDLPNILDENDKSQDWLGFYAYEDVFPLEVSCFAIYSYQVPTPVIKRRFVYGQGVGSADNINGTFGGTSAFIDYSFADYAVNYNYPDFANWNQGSFDNLTTSNKFLSTAEYELTEIIIPGKTVTQLYTDNDAVQDEDYKFLTFRPNSSWNSVNSYLNFPKFNILSSDIKAFYGIFKPETYVSDEILIKFDNLVTGNSLTIKAGNGVIKYFINYNQQEDNFLSVSYTPGQRIAVGFDIDKFSTYYGNSLAAFFGNPNGIQILVGGNSSSPTETYRGNIYSIGFCSEKNASVISDHFGDNGVAIITDAQYLLDHLASYTLLAEENYGLYNLDIGVASYWEDYIPLSYFATFINNADATTSYDLDFLQFNIGYPAASAVTETTILSGWTYQQLTTAYTTPIVKTYSQLANDFDDYGELEGNAQSVFDYNTEDSAVRSYITFQYILDGANLNNDQFTTTVNAEQTRLIDLSEYSNWTTTKFEVVDDTIIYPRKDIDFNEIAVVYSLEFKARKTIGKRVTIDKLQLASQAFNRNSFNPIGTRFGVNMYPYTKAGIYFDYKGKNPFSIYKGSTPYLYLTRTSGIQIRGEIDSIERGIAIPINEQKAGNYEINAMQIWLRYDNAKFPNQTIKLFEIEYRDDKISFYLEPTDVLNQRARIYALNNNNSQAFVDLSYYINGRAVPTPTISVREWTSLGIFFSSPLDLNIFTGKINLTAPFVFNNISFYKTNNLANVQNLITRSWEKARTDAIGQTPDGWEYWSSTTWFNVLVEDTYESTEFDPGTIYKAYIGTNKIIFDDDEGLLFQTDAIKSYSDIKWSRRTESAV